MIGDSGMSMVGWRVPLVGLTLALWACTGEGTQGPPGVQGPVGPQGEQGQPGDTGANSLIDSTTVDRGDANCPFGGVMYEVGLDDGSGGGVAGDGILQAGEVQSTDYVCHGLTTVVGYDPPAGPRGDGTIDLSGGTSTANYDGGEGGDIWLYNYGTSGGHLKIFATGQADASFTMPDVSGNVDVGPNPLVVTSGTTTVYSVADQTEASDGQYYIYNDSQSGHLYRRDSINGDTAITGLSVAAGATVEVEGDGYFGCCAYYQYINVDYDCYNAGTITTTPIAGLVDPTRRGGLDLRCANVITEPGSSFDLTGEDASSGDYGGEGGALRIYADGGRWYLQYGSIGTLSNQGSIDTSGGASVGLYGGRGGSVQLDGYDRLYNSGTITTRSSASTYYGGYPGSVYLYGGEGLYNSGHIDTSAGSTGRYGRDGGYLEMESNNEVRNVGTLTSHGGEQENTDCDTDCYGGEGGYVYMWAGGPGGIISSADVTLDGGDAADDQATAGDGGAVYFETSSGYGWFNDDLTPGSIHVSGDLDFTGGDSPYQAGDGGWLQADVSPDDFYNGQEVVLFGYDQVTLDGGDGGPTAGEGGWGGGVGFYSYGSESYHSPSGGVINHANISAVGGDSHAAGGYGGYGGYVELWTQSEYAFRGGSSVAINAGNIDLSAGAGIDYGGYAGCFEMFGANWSENSGDITALGGDATATGATTAWGGGGTYCTAGVGIYSSLGPATNEGAVDTTAGSTPSVQTGYGGEGGAVELVGATVDNTGSFTTAGGDGGSTAGDGGNGGRVYFRSLDDVTISTGTYDTVGGTGPDTDGLDGTIWIDGVNETP